MKNSVPKDIIDAATAKHPIKIEQMQDSARMIDMNEDERNIYIQGRMDERSAIEKERKQALRIECEDLHADYIADYLEE